MGSVADGKVKAWTEREAAERAPREPCFPREGLGRAGGISLPLCEFPAGDAPDEPGVAAALTLPRRDALLLIGAVWLANQVVGFAVLGYPWEAQSLAWSAALGVVALLATSAAQAAAPRLERAGSVATALASFAAAFVIYEGAIFALSVAVGTTEDFAPGIVGWIFATNAGATIGLLLLHRLGEIIGLAPAPLAMLARPA